MQDRMQQGDGVSVSLECGHANVKAGETCPYCGKQLEVITSEQVGNLADVIAIDRGVANDEDGEIPDSIVDAILEDKNGNL